MSVAVLCDNCKADISYTKQIDDYRLVLRCEGRATDPSIRMIEGGIFDPNDFVEPPIDRKHHFCHLGCLAMWIERK